MCESEGVSQQPPSQDPYPQQGAYGQPDPYMVQQGFSQPQYPGYPQYPQQPRQPLDIAKILFIGAWVVLTFYGLAFMYGLTLDERDPGGYEDFLDRLMNGMPTLGVGLFYTGVLLALNIWVGHQQKQGQGS